MPGLLLLSLLLTSASAATVAVPMTPAVDAGVPDTTSQAPPDILTNSPDLFPDTNVTDTPAPVTDTSAPVTDTSAPNVTAGMEGNATTTPQAPFTTTALPCQPSLTQIQTMFNYTDTDAFKDLSENQQILVYELLAAGEACRLKDFITPETAQRIFLLAEDLPLKNVYLLISFMARNMEAEGVVVPV